MVERARESLSECRARKPKPEVLRPGVSGYLDCTQSRLFLCLLSLSLPLRYAVFRDASRTRTRCFDTVEFERSKCLTLVISEIEGRSIIYNDPRGDACSRAETIPDVTQETRCHGQQEEEEAGEESRAGKIDA